MPEVVCGGVAALDITFAGLDALPAPGEERFSEALHWSPGGMATVAVGLARLEVAVALAAPLGRDLAGDLLRERLAAEGVEIVGDTIERTATPTCRRGSTRSSPTAPRPRR